jgi:hypothetical protein
MCVASRIIIIHPLIIDKLNFIGPFYQTTTTATAEAKQSKHFFL